MRGLSEKNRARVIFYSLFVGTVAFLAHRYWYSITVPIPTQDDEIREAVIYQDLDRRIWCGSGKCVCCMSFEGQGDPSDAFLARFHGRFRRKSECEHETVDRLSTRIISMIEIGRIERLGLLDAQVTVAVWCGPLCGSGATVRVHRTNDGWVVLEHRVGWVSRRWAGWRKLRFVGFALASG